MRKGNSTSFLRDSIAATLPRLAISVLAVSLAALDMGGCVNFSGGDGVPADLTKDLAGARRVIEAGVVPDPRWITVEEMIAEHDVSLNPPATAGDFFATAALGWNQDFDELTPLITVQVGYGTTLTLDTLRRESLSIGLLLDASGSMNQLFDARTGTTKLDAMLIAVDHLLAQLNSQDLISVVIFGDGQTTTLLQGTRGDRATDVKRALDGIIASGAPVLPSAMRQSFEVVRQFRSAARTDRLLVFTDAQLARGTPESVDVISTMQTYAADDIATTIFGVRVNVDKDFGFDIAEVSGGNFVFLNDFDRIVEVFDGRFDAVVTPVARDVDIQLSLPFELDVVDAFGLPSDAEPLTHLIELRIPTFFLGDSPGGESFFVRVRPGALVNFGQPIEAGAVSVSYTNSSGAQVENSLRLRLPASLARSGSPPFFTNAAVHRSVLLINTALTLRHACEDAYGMTASNQSFLFGRLDPQGRQQAAARLTDFLPYFDALAAGLEDQPSPDSPSLSEERALVAKLLQNVQ